MTSATDCLPPAKCRAACCLSVDFRQGLRGCIILVMAAMKFPWRRRSGLSESRRGDEVNHAREEAISGEEGLSGDAACRRHRMAAALTLSVRPPIGVQFESAPGLGLRRPRSAGSDHDRHDPRHRARLPIRTRPRWRCRPRLEHPDRSWRQVCGAEPPLAGGPPKAGRGHCTIDNRAQRHHICTQLRNDGATRRHSLLPPVMHRYSHSV